jgi:hypothetical protein
VHQQVDRDERFRLLAVEPAPDVRVRPDQRGRIHLALRVRAWLVRLLFEDRLTPPTSAELAELEQHDAAGRVAA